MVRHVSAGRVMRMRKRSHRRRARRNPDVHALLQLPIDAAIATLGATVGRFAQNFAALKLEKDPAAADRKAKAGKPLYLAIGTAAPVVIGVATALLAKQKRIGGALIVGGVVHGLSEVLRRYVFAKAAEDSPLYALGEDVSELGAIAQTEDGSEWAYIPDRGWHRIDDGRSRRMLSGLGAVELRDSLGAVELRDQLGGGGYVGSEWDSLGDLGAIELRDGLSGDEDLGAYPYGYDEG